ncbi:hypothetical protein ACFL6T_02070 [Candidatus Zixiibacteriota bacterium]
MRRYGGILVLLTALLVSGCMQAELLVKVKSDGSGTIETSVGMAKTQFAMMAEMAEMGGEGEDPFSEDTAREGASQYGEGITFVSYEKVDDEDMIGMRAVYAFEDINTVAASPMASQEDVEAKSMEQVQFSFDPADGGTLTVIMPGDPPEEAEPNEVEEGSLGMMKGFLAGMKMTMKLEVEPGIASVNTRNVDGNVITLFEFDFDVIAADDDNLKLFMENSNSGPQLAGVDGVSYVQENPIIVKFGAGGGGFPILYIGIAALLIIFVVGVVMAKKK